MPHNHTVYSQLLSLIPRVQFDRVVARFGGNRYVKTFRCWSQFIANCYAQITGKESLRDIETSFRTQRPKLYHMGCAEVKRATLAHANEHRDYRIYEELFYALLSKCHGMTGRAAKKKFTFKNRLYLLDSTTIDLCLSLFPWAKFRRRKGAIKLHCLFEEREALPSFLVVTDGKHHDVTTAKETTFPVSPDSIIVADKAYVDFDWLKSLDSRGIFLVTRAKENMTYRVVGQHSAGTNKHILADEKILLTGPLSSRKYPEKLRLVTFYDEEHDKIYRFLTNNFTLAASTIARIYKARWDIELFFKWIKQNLKIKSFLGCTKNAVLTQIWTAMIYYLLLTYIKYQTKYGRSLLDFSRVITTALFDRIHLVDLLSLNETTLHKVLPEKEQLVFL